MDKPMKSILKPILIQGIVQHYDWGGREFIPGLIGRTELSARPCAELWLGSHTKAPSIARVGGAEIPLTELLFHSGREILGTAAARRFDGQLPYLLKVLDAKKMLSIQAHPNLQQAAEGYARENKAGIDPSAPTRVYKDRNHKPEVHVALTEFWMLHGFRPLQEIADILDNVPELRPLMPGFRDQLALMGGDRAKRAALLRSLYERAMTLPQSQVDELLGPMLARLEKQGSLDKDLPDFWALRAGREFPLPQNHRDRGILSIYLLNLVHLRPGEAPTSQPGPCTLTWKARTSN
jgi:mannose-6-phosphate isomerase class I